MEGQACVQPDESRSRRHPCQRPWLDLTWSMGTGSLVRISDRLSWQSCRHSRSTGRCDTGLSNLLRRSAVHSGTVARRSINDPTTSDRKRRSTDLLVPQDSDPKTTPDSRTGRVVYALLVALAALYVQFGFFKPNGPLWGLIACSPLVPLLDRLFPSARYDWSKPTAGHAPVSVPLSLSLQPQRRFS
jgi:hypothetical protein